MKDFAEQFRECRSKGMAKPGLVERFKDHPNVLPGPFCRAAKVLAEKLKKNPNLGYRPMLCGRFKGRCHSGRVGCKRLRGWLI